MANYDRRSAEPDDVRVFDGGADDDDAEGSHLPVVIVISLLVLAAFGGVVWLAYNNGVAHGRADVPVHVADASSETPAAPPGSGDIPTKQIKVYQQPAGSDEDADQSAAPAQSQMAPAQHAQPVEAKPAEAKSVVAEAKPAPSAPAAKAPVSSMTAKAPQPAATAQSGLTPAKVRIKAAAEPAPATAAPAQLSLARSKPAEPAREPVASAAVSGGAYVLQIGAYKSQGDADAAWKVYRGKHATLLTGLGPDVQKVDLGDKGTWYRLRVGSFADKSAAAAMCSRLTADGGACFPAK